MKVNKCKSRQRAGKGGVERAAAIADRNREVCEMMCHSNMIHSAYILMQTGKTSPLLLCVYDWSDSELRICYKSNFVPERVSGDSQCENAGLVISMAGKCVYVCDVAVCPDSTDERNEL